MKKILFTTALAALFSVGAQAAIVTYSTSTSTLLCGVNPGCVSNIAGNVLTLGGGTGVTVSFIGSTQTVDATTFASLGDIIIACVGGGTGCASRSLAGLSLNITVVQTVPLPGGTSSISSGAITGAIAGSTSSGQITWTTPNTISIGSISYGVQNNPLALVPPSSFGGDTTIQGVITDRTVPEPSTYALLASGLVALGLLRRRR